MNVKFPYNESYWIMNVRFAQIVVVTDYHEIQAIADSFPALKLSSRELGMSNNKYVGVVFDGSVPGDGEIADLLLEAGVTLNSEDEGL